ncbi:MAG: hypothetical protein ACREU9_09155 [Gammaproteobacteria bacterium]
MLERVEQEPPGLGLGEVAQCHRVFEIDRRIDEQIPSHEIPHLGIQHVVAAHEAQFLQQLAGDESNHGAVVRGAGAIEPDGVMHFGIEHGLEDDLARLFRREGLMEAKL